jgi:RNA polymerase sigma-70 factor (ECF subfamily)
MRALGLQHQGADIRGLARDDDVHVSRGLPAVAIGGDHTGIHGAFEALRRRLVPDAPAPTPNAEEMLMDDAGLIPDERLRLIFICCHPTVAVEARAALTLRLVCGLGTTEIARAFLVPEATLAQRLVRAKRKIADSGVPFEVPRPEAWSHRLDAVLSTVEVAYAKAHEDAAGAGAYAGYANEMLELTRVLTTLLPHEAECLALAATVRYAEARRPARLDAEGAMVPLSEQDPALWRRPLIEAAHDYLRRALACGPAGPRTLQAAIHNAWCAGRSLAEPAPWPAVLQLYDLLLAHRDDAIVRLNRAVALAESEGAAVALAEVDSLKMQALEEFLPYHAVRADLLRRLYRWGEARAAYDAALALGPASAERLWLQRQKGSIPESRSRAISEQMEPLTRFHLLGNARPGDAGLTGHIPFG